MWQPPCHAGKRPRGVDARVRRRLRELRTASGLTLQQVADAAPHRRVDAEPLETGKRRLALDHIPALAAALGVSTDELLGPAPRRTHASAEPRRFDGMTMWPLTNRGPAAGVHAYRIRSSPRRNRRPSCRCTTATTGCTSSRSPAPAARRRRPDDRAGRGRRVRHDTPHWFGALDGPVELIGIFGAHGERAHLHR